MLVHVSVNERINRFANTMIKRCSLKLKLKTVLYHHKTIDSSDIVLLYFQKVQAMLISQECMANFIILHNCLLSPQNKYLVVLHMLTHFDIHIEFSISTIIVSEALIYL